nr:putative HAD-IB family hydrolase [uncultured bacterium]
MSRATAAIFDLDRTIIGSASGRIFAHHLAEAGLTRADGSAAAIADLMFETFNRFGESGLLMRLARLAPRSAKGQAVADIAAAAAAAAPDLHDSVQPFAFQVFDEHRSAGRKLVLATTSPRHMVEPLAEMLEFDQVIATTWEVGDDGNFTGAIDGDFVWGRGKAKAVKAWARANKIDLRESYAYSDSYYDAPLLAAVGHPIAVNPDARLASLSFLRGWPIRHLDAPEGVVKIFGREFQELIRPLTSNEDLIPNARFEITGLHNIPAEGGAIVCANHRSYFDPTVMSLILAKAGRNARFLGKKEVFDAPIIGQMAVAAGGIRVERASGSSEPLERAAVALRAGEVVGLMPEGTIPRGPAFFNPELKGRWGAAKLAAMSGADVIPVGIWGTEKVWPRSARLPKLNLTDPPLITVNIGKPVKLKHRSPDADTTRIMAAIMDLLPPEASEQREPTLEELALTFPPGYTGDPTAEDDRRPGTDT